MAKKRTNIFEMLLSNLLVGRTIYDDDGNPVVVNSVRYSKTNTVYATDTSGNTVSFFIDDNIDVEMDEDIVEGLDKDKIKKLTNKGRNG
jgi:hypothetical protein